MTSGLKHCKFAIVAALLAGSMNAQSNPNAVDTAAKQRAAAAAMQESLAKQRASIDQQTGKAGGGDFFLLPRAAGLGGVTGAIAAPAPIAPIGMPLAAECDPLPASEVESLVGETSERDGVSADLLRSVIKQESGFRPCAVSSKGAMGLMQLMPGTAGQLGILDPFDPISNLDGGARFLKQLLTRYGGDVPKALGAYNAGPAKVDATGAVPAIPETVDYVRQILAALPFH